MKNTLKRALCLALTLAICCSTLLVAGAAGQSLTQRQKAVIETAMAYYYRGSAVQYDAMEITVQGKYSGGILREIDYCAPEDATADNTMYSVCSAYCFEVYYNTIGYQIMGGPLACKTRGMTDLPADDPVIAYKWTSDGNVPIATALGECRKAMQPGDVIVGYGSDSGHAMLYLGDVLGDGTDYIAHCFGTKYNMESGSDPVETKRNDNNGGAIRLEPVDSACFNASGVWPLAKMNSIVLMRPLACTSESDYPLTAAAKGRLKYSGIDIDRRASVDRYRDVVLGGDVTVTLNITNNSKDAYTALPVAEVVPDGMTLKAGSVAGGGTVSGANIAWSLSVPAGETKTVSYTLTAPADDASRGKTFVLGGGNVGGIPSNTLPVVVGGARLTAADEGKLSDVAAGKYRSDLSGGSYTGTEFAEAVYEKVLGLYPNLPSFDAVKNLYARVAVAGAAGRMMERKKTDDAADAQAAAMLVPYFIGGKMLQTATSKDRILSFETSHLQAGDVIVYSDSPYSGGARNAVCYVYLGNDKVVSWQNNACKVEDAKVLGKLLIHDFFFALRPTLAYNDLHTDGKKLVKFDDVAAADWFYTYVTDLAAAGTVNGMTATTFKPAGTVTYGQALKLITLAAKKPEQKATAGHWASGYLTYAQSSGWVTGSPNLDGSITRLALCQIAAKALGLTEQPAANPFTDTADAGVLALNKAGIISGMTDTTFAPEKTLTRAQISKIIWCMGKL